MSLSGLTAWKILATELVLAGLMSLLTVVRHTRTEEENDRAELVGAGVVGRATPLTAALLTAGLADLALGALVALGLFGSRLPVAGSVVLGLAPALAGAVFAAVAAVAAQLCQSGRSATAVAAGVLGGSYLLRAVGDTGPTWLSWLSPIGALTRLRPYAAERWWVARRPPASPRSWPAGRTRWSAGGTWGPGCSRSGPGRSGAPPGCAARWPWPGG